MAHGPVQVSRILARAARDEKGPPLRTARVLGGMHSEELQQDNVIDLLQWANPNRHAKFIVRHCTIILSILPH